MAFRRSTKPPQFADLKTTLAQSRDVDNSLYQVVQEIIERLASSQSTVSTETIIQGGPGGGTGGATDEATYLTKANETATLPNSLQFVARYGLKFDDSVPNRRTIDLDLEYVGSFVAGPLYSDGDVVVGTDNVAYMCVRPTNSPPVPWPGTGIISPPVASIIDATFWTASAHPELLNERNLGALANGYVKSTGGEPSTVSIIPLSEGGTGSSLSITPNGTVMMSNGSQVVLASGVNITQLNATSLITGTVNDARLSSNVPLKNQVNQFTRGQRISNAGGDWPRLTMSDLTQGPDSKTWEINIVGGQSLNFWALNDAENSILGGMAFFRDGQIQAAGLSTTPLNASRINQGMVGTPYLGTGTANSSTYLRGDNTWQPLSDVSIPSGLIVLSMSPCPIGWTRVNWDGLFVRSGPAPGALGGAWEHTHGPGSYSAGAHNHGGGGSVSVSGSTSADGDHNHSFGASFAGTVDATGAANTADAGGSFQVNAPNHTHNFRGDVSGTTGGGGTHSHSFSGSGSVSVGSEAPPVVGTSAVASNLPPFIDVFFCQKN